MKKCVKCGAELESDDLFCTICGTKQPELKLCPKCGNPIEDDDAFCVHCGAKIENAIDEQKETANPLNEEPITEVTEENKKKAGDLFLMSFGDELKKEDKIDLLNQAIALNPSEDVYKKRLERLNKEGNKKTLIVVVFIVVLIGLLAAGGYFLLSNKGETEESFVVAEIDTATVEYEHDEEIEDPCNYYGDGVTFGIRGRVKNFSVYNSLGYEEYSVDFDSNGRYIPKDSECDIITRDDEGRISRWNWDDGGGYNVMFEYANGKVRRETAVEGVSYCALFSESEAEETSLEYRYNGDQVSSLSMLRKFGCGNYISITNSRSYNTTLTVTILQTDDRGNWTERRIQGEVIELKDEGFELAGHNPDIEYENGYEAAKMYYAKRNIDETQKRVIVYY